MYTGTLHQDLRYLATWTPDREIAVGDIMIMQEDRSLERQQALHDLEVDFEERSESAPGPMHYVSRKGLTVTTGAGAEVEGLPFSGSAELRFETERATFFRLEGAREHSMKNLYTVKEAMLRLHAKGDWREEWIVITHVVKAARSIVLVSKDGKASAQLAADARLPGDAAGIASASAHLRLVSYSDMELVLPERPDTTPLYHAVTVRRSVLKGGRVVRTGKDGRLLPPANSKDTDVIDVVYDDV